MIRICNSNEGENVFGDGLNLVLALGRTKDIETRLVLGELVISNTKWHLRRDKRDHENG